MANDLRFASFTPQYFLLKDKSSQKNTHQNTKSDVKCQIRGCWECSKWIQHALLRKRRSRDLYPTPPKRHS